MLLPEGSATWASALTYNKNISIIGAGASLTHITGAAVFNGTANLLTPGKLLRISGMTITSDFTKAPLTFGGTAPINEADMSGGIRIDHVIFNGSGGGYTMVFNGWLEGVIDHVILDFDLSKPLGETIIINHITSPTGTGSFGDYSWSHPYQWAGIHQIFLEDSILKRRGGTDTNQFPNGGGSRYTSRHNTAWCPLVGGHGSRESGGVRVTGHFASEGYKNLFVRDGNAFNQGGNDVSARSGSIVLFGNRWNRYGASTDAASSPLQAQNYQVTSQRNGDNFGGPNGTNAFDENQKGMFTINEPGTANNGKTYAPDITYDSGTVTNGVDSVATKGDVYAHGTGGTKNGDTITLNGLDYHGGNGYWNDFVIINKSISPTSSSPVPFTYITATGGSSLTVMPNNIYAGSQAAITAATMTIGAGDPWEIRRVKTYFLATGSGLMDTSLDSSSTGPFAARLLLGTPNPRWTNQVASGLWQWDNKYRLSATGVFAKIANWMQPGSIYIHSARNVHNDPDVPPGYPYDRATPADASNPNTRVGADAEVWAMAPSSVTSIPDVTNGAATSFFENGSGGYRYPHPLVK